MLIFFVIFFIFGDKIFEFIDLLVNRLLNNNFVIDKLPPMDDFE
jgi:hypothetical protein